MHEVIDKYSLIENAKDYAKKALLFSAATNSKVNKFGELRLRQLENREAIYRGNSLSY